MNGHQSIRGLLALAAAGVLQIDEQSQVDEHVGDCADCRAELEHWLACAQGLQHLRQPAVPANLMERTRARILQERATAAGRRTEGVMLSALAAFAWIIGLTSWFLLRVFTGGALVFLGADLTRLVTWSLASTVFVWLTAAAATLLLGRRANSGAFHDSLS